MRPAEEAEVKLAEAELRLWRPLLGRRKKRETPHTQRTGERE